MADQQNPAGEKPKIVVDEDWKAQAQQEKEKLAEQEKTGEAAGRPEERELPPASFSSLISGFVTQILFALGGIPDRAGRRYIDLPLAKHHIDTLSVLEAKTKGNLTDEEKKLLDRALYETRMQYVHVVQGGLGT